MSNEELEQELDIEGIEQDLLTLVEDRHPETQHAAKFFRFTHLKHYFLRSVSYDCAKLAYIMIGALPDGPELTAGLRKLLEAKDCFVRTALEEVEELDKISVVARLH